MWESKNVTYSYEIIWRASQTAIELAEKADRRNQSHLSINSILTGFCAFEGFINYVGREIAPEVWEYERNTFSGKKELSGKIYRGIEGKIEYLYTLFCKSIEKGKEPYQTFKNVKTIRDDIAHNRVIENTTTTREINVELHTRRKDFDSPCKVKPALCKLKDLAETIRLEALEFLKNSHDEFKFGYGITHWNFKAFEGPLGTSEGKETT